MQINGELQALIGQLEINKAEAASGNAFPANWRPSVGYVCAAALCVLLPHQPAANVGGRVLPSRRDRAPAIGIDDHLWELMAGMLGLAGWRTMDKIKGLVSHVLRFRRQLFHAASFWHG